MTHDSLRRLPPPPLFTIRPPPKPPGPLFEHFQTVEILNGQCINIKSSLNIFNTSSIIPQTNEEQTNWLNLFLLVLAIISVISCIIIAIFIFICLKKLKKEEKQYKNYVMNGSISSKSYHHSDVCTTRTSEHYKCTPTALNCCDDYYTHQLIPMAEASSPSVVSPPHHINQVNNIDSSSRSNNLSSVDNPQNHQYECIPECFLTITRHRRHDHPSIAYHRQHQLCHRPNPCSIPYATFSRSILVSQGLPTTSTSDSSQCTCSPPTSTATATVVLEESSTPLLDSSLHRDIDQKEELVSLSKSMMIGWTKPNSLTSGKRKAVDHTNNEQRDSFLSQLRKSSVLQQ